MIVAVSVLPLLLMRATGLMNYMTLAQIVLKLAGMKLLISLLIAQTMSLKLI
jgi:hypothetical protein